MLVLNLTVTIPSFNASGNPKLMFGADRLRIFLQSTISQIFSVCFGVFIVRSPWVQKTPEGVFLLFNGLVLFPAQITAALHGEVNFDGETWLIYYAIQAILIPVHWRLHLISQVVVLGYFTIAFLLGWRDPYVIVPSVYILGAVYTTFICAVADFGVFWYERSRQRELELRQQLKVFLHAVSHDLRNPVLGLVIILKEFWNPEEKNAIIPQEMLKQMIDSGDRQVALINSLLEAHTTETHGILLQRQPLNLAPLVVSILTDLQPFLQKANTTIIQTITTDLPTIDGDALHLRRVYENLILNAIKYNRPGLRVTLDAEVFHQSATAKTASSQWVRCTVRDNGVGMLQAQCDRLFDLYTRGPSNRQIIGLGLGLYICRQIVIAHGGEIGVESSPGAGSTFWFTLPIA